MPRSVQPARWAVILAFALVYLSWGTTFLAIKKGVESFPPALFGGSRVALAGALLLLYLRASGRPLRMPRADFLWTALAGVLLFVGGNGLLTVAEKTVPSGVASVLGATSPLWVVLLEAAWPWGERLRLRGWIGLVGGFCGVIVLLAPRLHSVAAFFDDTGPLLVLGSAAVWALGSSLMRNRRLRGTHLTAAAYQMFIGGGCLLLLGLACGEAKELDLGRATGASIYAFFHLLIFGSLIGFVAYNWLMNNVSAALAQTYGYVNPMVAVLAGWLLDGEPITASILAGMTIILIGVGLIRAGGVRTHSLPAAPEEERNLAKRLALVTTDTER